MAMLVAITLMLSAISGYLRIGDAIKFNISFISVYVGAALYGPLAGGIIAAMADVISFLINPTGAFIPVFTIMEFVNGFLFGIFLYKTSDQKRKAIKLFLLVLICTLLQFCVNMFWRTYELSSLYKSPFWTLFGTRLPGNVVMVVCKITIIMLLEPYMGNFRKMVVKDK
jgi:ECF transporter S component (folate family)